jgi:predicted ATPase
MKFCGQCASPLTNRCSTCGFENPPDFKFCGQCGAGLGDKVAPPQAERPQAAVPTSFAGGRYQVRQFLGEGGKKKVYLAHDSLLDRDVAFALIKAEGLDDAARQRVSREAQAMGRLGSHPHIVTVFDLGRDSFQGKDQPYMVTELMVGGDVEGVIDTAPDHRLPLEQAITIALQVCRALEFAHNKGIVHRDLKPSNVWLTQDGIVKIGDFGLAVALDRSRLTAEGMMVGTVAYMPPEQALGSQVTPRADLYSLGAMLYEMVTGRPPFLGDDPVAIIGQHINTPPVAPTWHNGQCPRPLEALILRLLAKDPSERPGSASDVLAALEAIDTTDVGAPLAAPLDQARALDSLAGGVFVGRQREMGELKAALEDALSGRGRLVTLVGEPGVGKTRTAQELVTYAGLRQCQVLWGRCYEGEGAPPYWPWVQAIRSYVRDRDAAQVRSEMGAGAADIAEVVSDVRERLPDLKPPPQLEPEQARFRLFDSITAFLKSAGRRQPQVLVLEDLHWADRPSLLLLEFLARELGGSRLLVIGTYRDVEVSRRHPLSQTLGELTRERLFQRVLLRGLSQEDVGRFIELVAGITPPRGMVEAVYRQTEGNPLFVTEVVRLLVQEGSLTPQPPLHLRDGEGETARGRGGEAWTVRIPEGVREVIGRRLDRLSERCNQTLTIAAVIGREFTLEQLKPLIDDPSAGSGLAMTEDRLLEVLEEALAARVIEELPRAVGRYQFTHALIQETLLEELTLTRRVRLHARIAQALEELYGPEAEAHAAELAHHFAEAQTVLGTEKLVRYSLLAGEKALASYAYEEALAHCRRALVAKGVSLASREPAGDAETAALLYSLTRAEAATSGAHVRQEQIANLRRAFDFYAEAGDLVRAVAVAEDPLFHGFEGAGASEIGARALSLVAPDSHEAGRLLCHYGMTHYHETADYLGAKEAFARAIAIAQREGDTALEALALANASHVDGDEHRWDESLENSLRAIQLARQSDNTRAEDLGRRSAGEGLMARGDFEGALLHAEAGLANAARLRQESPLCQALWANMAVAYHRGDWRSARAFTDRGLAVSSRNIHLLRGRAQLEYEVGDFDEGEAFLERLVEVTHRSPPGPSQAYAFTALVISEIAHITGVTNRLDVAEAAAKVVLSSPFAIPRFAMGARTGLALIAVLRGDEGGAKEQYAALESQRGSLLPRNLITVDHLLGLLAQTMGQLDRAVEHFEDALAFCRKAGYRPELAWTCCDYADMLLQRVGAQHAAPLQPSHTPGNRARAMALLDEALAISSELGMRPLMERVLSRRQILTA